MNIQECEAYQTCEHQAYDRWVKDGKPWPNCLHNDDCYEGPFCVGCGCCEDCFIDEYGSTALHEVKRISLLERRRNRCLTD